MGAGAHKLRIEPSSGWQQFSGFSFIDPATGDTVVSKQAPDATADGPVPNCETASFCPTGFKSVALEAGGAVTLSHDFKYNAFYLARIFYDAPNGGSANLLLNRQMADVITLAPDQGDVFTNRYPAQRGMHTMTIQSVDGGVNIDYVQFIAVSPGPTANEPAELPEGYELGQNYPNPFNPTTNISFTLADAGAVRLTVYDLLGREVAKLVDQTLPAGATHVTWNAAETSGLASGVYFYRLETPVGHLVRSMVLLK